MWWGSDQSWTWREHVMDRLCFIFVVAASYLVSCAWSREIAEADFVAQGGCDVLCRELGLSADPATPCKAFVRALPHPKMGRTCTIKFREGFTLACPLVCSRLARGGRADFLPWIERITHSVCQELSGDIPYPAVFNSCKMGYSKGLSAAFAAVSRRLGRGVTTSSLSEDINICEHEGEGDPNQDAELQARVAQQLEHGGTLTHSTAATTELEAELHHEEQGTALVGILEEYEPWMEAVEATVEYVDYVTVARERVGAARQRRGSELKRGPACPVCGG